MPTARGVPSTCRSRSSADCDEDQFSYPETGSDGTLYVHFFNFQNEDAWEVPFDFDAQLMVVRSMDGGLSFEAPVPVVQLEDGTSDMPWSVIGTQTVWGHQIRWGSFGNISVNPNDPEDVVVVYADRRTPNPNATEECILEVPGEAPNYDPCTAGPGSDTDVFMSRSTDGGKTWSGRILVDGNPAHKWFPWADHKPDGSLAIAWDEDDGATEWPVICGPAGYTDPPVANAEGKDCNAFHGDYTGLAAGPDGRVHVVWTGLNRAATSPQVDFYTGEWHDGFAQDAMYASR